MCVYISTILGVSLLGWGLSIRVLGLISGITKHLGSIYTGKYKPVQAEAWLQLDWFCGLGFKVDLGF